MSMLAVNTFKEEKAVQQAWHVVSGSFTGVAACGELVGWLGLLRAAGSCRGWQGGSLLPSSIGGVHVVKFARHPQLQELKERRGDTSLDTGRKRDEYDTFASWLREKH